MADRLVERLPGGLGLESVHVELWRVLQLLDVADATRQPWHSLGEHQDRCLALVRPYLEAIDPLDLVWTPVVTEPLRDVLLRMVCDRIGLDERRVRVWWEWPRRWTWY